MNEVDQARARYQFRLEESERDRCFDCGEVDIGFGTGGACSRLNIRMENIKRSRCQLHARDDEAMKGEHGDG